MGAMYDEVYIQLINSRTGKPINDDAGLYQVLNAGSASEETIYSDKWGTSGSNPGTLTDGVARFWVAAGTTSVDVSILTSHGFSKFVNNVRCQRHHRVEIDPQDNNDQLLVVGFHMNTGCAAVADTGFDLLAGMLIKDVFVDMTVGSTGAGCDFGVSGDTDGFIDLCTTTSTGQKIYGVITTSATAGVDYVSGTQIRGKLITDWGTGLTTACASGPKGFFTKKDYMVTADTSLVYVVAATNSAGSGRGYIYVKYDRIPTVATAITDS